MTAGARVEYFDPTDIDDYGTPDAHPSSGTPIGRSSSNPPRGRDLHDGVGCTRAGGAPQRAR